VFLPGDAGLFLLNVGVVPFCLAQFPPLGVLDAGLTILVQDQRLECLDVVGEPVIVIVAERNELSGGQSGAVVPGRTDSLIRLVNLGHRWFVGNSGDVLWVIGYAAIMDDDGLKYRLGLGSDRLEAA
jgi:hypothetical protein